MPKKGQDIPHQSNATEDQSSLGATIDSSDEESTVEIGEEPTEASTEVNTHNEHPTNPMINDETTARNVIHIPMVS